MAALLGLSPLLGTSAVSADSHDEVVEVVPEKRFSVHSAAVHEGHTAEIDVFLSSPAPSGGLTFSISYDFGSGATATKADFVGGDSLFKTSLTIDPRRAREGESYWNGGDRVTRDPVENYGTRGTLRFPVKFDNADTNLSDEPEEKVSLTFSTTTTGWAPVRDGANIGSIIIYPNAPCPDPFCVQGSGQSRIVGAGQPQQPADQGAYVGGAGADPDTQGDTQGPPQQQASPHEEKAESAPLAEPGTVPYVQAVPYGKSVIVMWSAPQNGGEPDQYVVRLKTDNKGKAKIKRVGADANNVTFGKVKAGTHTVYVRARNDAGGGKWATTQVTVR